MTNNMSLKFKSGNAVGAMLGAAYGDALGWPNERISKSKASKQSPGRLQELREWSRRTGGRFFSHEEIINAGGYSDDTQLILCLSRSLLKREKWLDYYTKVELPFWSLYERGGGGATKRSVNSWIDGIEPWSHKCKPQDVKKYFNAGGNGVAMRVLPHVLYGGDAEFDVVAQTILMDGISTHGHPIALLGALVYGFALWSALQKNKQLGYGELINEIIENESAWATVRVLDKLPPEWKSQAEDHLVAYNELWTSATNEILSYLSICKSAIANGALSFDDDVLEKLNCFDRKISGAGTVAGVAAIYLASRYAADPLNGVIKPAFVVGSDTDTIASMTGGLLGCINGAEWLSSVRNGIQDAAYLEKLALKLSNHEFNEFSSFSLLKKTALKNWTNDMMSASDSSGVMLPDGRSAKINFSPDQVGPSGKYKIEFRKLVTVDGQTLFVKKRSKGEFGEQPSQQKPSSPSQPVSTESFSFGPKLPVLSLDDAVHFYRDLLGLKVKKKTKDVVSFENGLVLVAKSYCDEFQHNGFKSLLYVEVSEIEKRYKWAVNSAPDIQIMTPLAHWKTSQRYFFRCLDRDGNLLEVFEKQ